MNQPKKVSLDMPGDIRISMISFFHPIFSKRKGRASLETLPFVSFSGLSLGPRNSLHYLFTY
jgi:hypothetical protein